MTVLSVELAEGGLEARWADICSLGRKGVGVGMGGLTERDSSVSILEAWGPAEGKGLDTLWSSCGLGFSPLSSDGSPGVWCGLQSLWFFPPVRVKRGAGV